MVYECSCEGDALGHAAGELVGIGLGEGFEAHESHEFVNDVVADFSDDAAGDEAGGDVSADGEPGEEVGVLEDQAAIGGGGGDGVGAGADFAGVGLVEAGDQSQQGGFSATAGAEEGDQLAGVDVERCVFEDA